MNRIFDFMYNLNSDEKKYIVIGMITIVVLSMYAFSKNSDFKESVVIQSKSSDFKGGDIVFDRASDYYQSKDRLLSKQYDTVKNSQDKLHKQIKDLQIALTKLEKQNSIQLNEEPIAQDDVLKKLKEHYGKKLNQRVQKQLKIKFHYQDQLPTTQKTLS